MKILSIVFLFFISTISYSQNRGFCELSGCSLPENHDAHFDPYYNGHLCENFNPQQSDFSKEYMKLRTEKASKTGEEVTKRALNYDLDLNSIFNTGQNQLNGIIGLDNKRIKIHIHRTERAEKEKGVFTIYGKSNVNGNICDFQGTVKVLRIYEISDILPGLGQLFAEYEFFEDINQKHVGAFKGVFESSIMVDHQHQTLNLNDDFLYDADQNRTYVGVWESYKGGILKKCIWGNNRLPFTFDFDCGDGEMRVCEKYEKNGWELFNRDKEYEVIDGQTSLKDKWWLSN